MPKNNPSWPGFPKKKQEMLAWRAWEIDHYGHFQDEGLWCLPEHALRMTEGELLLYLDHRPVGIFRTERRGAGEFYDQINVFRSHPSPEMGFARYVRSPTHDMECAGLTWAQMGRFGTKQRLGTEPPPSSRKKNPSWPGFPKKQKQPSAYKGQTTWGEYKLWDTTTSPPGVDQRASNMRSWGFDAISAPGEIWVHEKDFVRASRFFDLGKRGAGVDLTKTPRKPNPSWPGFPKKEEAPAPLEWWDIWSLDVWGNAKHGFEVNDRSRSGHLCLPTDFTDDYLKKKIIDNGLFKPHVKPRHLNIEGDADGELSIEDSKTGEPYYQLERNEERDNECEED